MNGRLERAEYVARWRVAQRYLVGLGVRGTVTAWLLIGLTVYGTQEGWAWASAPLWAFLLISAVVVCLAPWVGVIFAWNCIHDATAYTVLFDSGDAYHEPWFAHLYGTDAL